MTPKCLLHLASAPGLLTTSELSLMSRVDERRLYHVLDKPQVPPKHLSSLAHAYRQILSKKIQEEQHAFQDKLISTILESENSVIPIEDDLLISELPNDSNAFDHPKGNLNTASIFANIVTTYTLFMNHSKISIMNTAYSRFYKSNIKTVLD